MQRIFVSFRKEDDRATREQLYARLSPEFGEEQVFKSGESIPPGTDYVRILWAQARACPVMLVLIGQGWIGAAEPDGSRSIDQVNDWVRLEIRTAFESGNRVIPVLLGDDVMLPAPAQLPPDIAALGTLQALRVAHSAVNSGLDQLVGVLHAVLPRLAQPGGPEGTQPPAPPAAPGPHHEVRAHDVGVGVVTGTVHGPVIGGNAQGPVIGRDARGPVVGGDFHQTNVKKGGVGAAAVFATVLATLGRPFNKAADWAGDHRLIASIGAAVVFAGAGTGIAVAVNSGNTPSANAPVSAGIVGLAATTPAASTPAAAPSPSPSPTPTLTSGTSLSSVSTISQSGNAWADGSVLMVQEVAQLASPGSGANNDYQLQSYSIATGQQLAGFTPDGFDQGTVCIDDLVRSAQNADVLLAEKTDEVPAQGLTPASYSVDLMGIDARTGDKLWDATLPVVGTNETDFCNRTDPPDFLSYTADGKYALDIETGTTYLVNLANGAVTPEPAATQVLGRWLAEPSTAQVPGEGYPVTVAIVDPSTGATVHTVADDDTGLSGDAQGGDDGAPGLGNGGYGMGVDLGGAVDLVTGSRVNALYGGLVAYSLPSFHRIWSVASAAYDALVYDPTDPGIAVAYDGQSTITGVDVKSGRALWTVTADSYYCGVTNGHVYVVANGQVAELDETTGKQIGYDANYSGCPLILNGVIDKVSSDQSTMTYTNDFIIG